MSIEIYYIVSGHDNIYEIKWVYFINPFNVHKDFKLLDCTSDTFDTYEAALEAGLQKCLTILIDKQ